MAPSASVWHRLEKKRWAAPKVAAGFFSPRLPDAPLGPATREIDGFKNGLPGAKVLVYPDLEASEERFMEVAPQAEWLHLSTHGEFPERNANEFHEIRLVPSKGYDGHLQALEIKSLDLHRTSLVVLAICNGGLYSVGPADEPYGLMPAFLASGAGNVVGTLWPLDNEFGKEYMVRYYKQLGRLGPARAQQATARSFIDEKEMVLHWAGFVTVGPGRPFQ